mgnify:CR=1 FL=1
MGEVEDSKGLQDWGKVGREGVGWGGEGGMRGLGGPGGGGEGGGGALLPYKVNMSPHSSGWWRWGNRSHPAALCPHRGGGWGALSLSM